MLVVRDLLEDMVAEEEVLPLHLALAGTTA